MRKKPTEKPEEKKLTTEQLARMGPQLEDSFVEDETDLIRLLRKDVIAAVEELIEKGEDGLPEMRYLVRLYYQHQKFRMHSGNVIKRYSERGKSHTLVSWAFHRDLGMEKNLVSALSYYAAKESTGMGAWAQQAVGIGPVISVGLLANIDKRRRKISQLWSFAGLNPDMPKKWGSLGKRPFNSQLKLLAFKVGHSFMMMHNKPHCFYGHIYAQRKAYEIERNVSGGNKELAAKILSEKRFSDDTNAKAALTAGRLPDAQIEQRSERFATKLFLCHWQAEAYYRWFGEPMPEPWIVSEQAQAAGLGVHHYIEAPPEMQPLSKAPLRGGRSAA